MDRRAGRGARRPGRARLRRPGTGLGPVRAAPAFLDVGSAETFRDEVVDYASRIWRAGGVAELHVWPGGFHGFDAFAPHAALARTARAARLAWLRRLLAR